MKCLREAESSSHNRAYGEAPIPRGKLWWFGIHLLCIRPWRVLLELETKVRGKFVCLLSQRVAQLTGAFYKLFFIIELTYSSSLILTIPSVMILYVVV